MQFFWKKVSKICPWFFFYKATIKHIYFKITQGWLRYSIFFAFVIEQGTASSASTAAVVTLCSSKRSEEASHFNQPLLLPGTLRWLWVRIPCLHGNRHVIGRSKGAFGISNQVAVWLLFCLAILLFACWDLAPLKKKGADNSIAAISLRHIRTVVQS